MTAMSVPVTSGRGLVHVTEHQFLVHDERVVPPSGLAILNGLVATETGVAVIYTGISSGRVTVTAEAYASTPALNSAGWEEIVETSLAAPDGRVSVAALMAEGPGLPDLTPAGPGTYRLRVHAKGRDAAVDLAAWEPVEEYLIQAWPSDHAPEAVLRHTDSYGSTIRSTNAIPPPQPPIGTASAQRRAAMLDNLRRAGSPGAGTA
jgi:hypothetical protein